MAQEAPPGTVVGAADAQRGVALSSPSERTASGRCAPKIGLSAPSDLLSTARAIRTATFLCAVDTPSPGRNDGDPRHHVCGPFLCGLIGAHAGIAGQSLALDKQRDVAGTEYRAVGEQPINRHIVHQQNA